MSEQTYSRWKAKCGGMTSRKIQHLHKWEQEHVQLTRLLADAMLDNVALKDVRAKQWKRLPCAARR